MGFTDILNQYASGAPGTASHAASEHFDQIAGTAPAGVVGHGLAEAFRAEQTPPFSSMVGQLFGNSSPQQRAGLLNELLGSLGPGVLGGLAASPLADMLRRMGGSASPITPEQASAVSPQQVQEVAHQAEQQNPGIVDRIGQFYAQHPQVVKTLGGAVLAIALAKMAQRAGA